MFKSFVLYPSFNLKVIFLMNLIGIIPKGEQPHYCFLLLNLCHIIQVKGPEQPGKQRTYGVPSGNHRTFMALVRKSRVFGTITNVVTEAIVVICVNIRHQERINKDRSIVVDNREK